jgi:putative long chain acyl-CoA synthase
VDEVGMLLARVGLDEPLSVVALRGVFASEDAWVATGDLFRRDADGDYWRVDGVGEVIRTADGPVFTSPIRDALGELDAVDLAVAYGVSPPGGEHQVAVAALTLRSGHELSPRELSRALARLPARQRPLIIRRVERIPVTTWFRPLTGPLREQGIPEPGEDGEAWYLDASGERYRPLTDTARKRLVAAA